MADEPDRVKIWNSYLLEARNLASKLKNDNTSDNITDVSLDGGNLSFEEHYSLMTILHLVIAIEARTNHLLHEFKEKGYINKELRDAVGNLNIKHKWMLLPQLAGKRKKISYTTMPHQAIVELYKYRTQFIHVTYQREDFIEKIPTKEETTRLYNYFIEAMEDMNVILGRIKHKRKTVLVKLKV